MVPWVSFWRPWGSLGVPRGPQEVPRVLGQEPKGTEDKEGSLGVSGETSGGSLGRSSLSGAVLRSSPGVQMLIFDLF